MSASGPKLFQPVKVGRLELKHRVVLAPLTRDRADTEHVHTDLGIEYYVQRASTPGTLLISEGTFIVQKAGSDRNVPALETDAQLAAWKKITDAVHAKGSYIYAQLWAQGRQSDPKDLAKDGHEYVSASDFPLERMAVNPRPLTTAEVKDPWGFFGGMRMTDPKPQFSHIIENIAKSHSDLAYIHVVEPRVQGNSDRTVQPGESNDFIRDIWSPRPLLSAGGYNRELGLKAAEKGDIVVYGRYFISNPDLPFRLEKNIPLTPYNRDTFYLTLSPIGYTDYPFATEQGKAERTSL
ncbi:hypothetical protein EIP91_005960 [Steccherinum ochraceum]|uniref:NADH:flavin oxidoreductase/NADH oxidase N-terminal domain-containing protein n=1 Tax=Steccherinum ochraceum TaxID=92696 RepID=A0A4R0RRL0_9APHY|nr:hypothetical protein EIP91_005960 [Steccherinum ochraceum]